MLKWQVGDVTITRIVELEVPVPYHPKRPMFARALPEELAKMPWLYPHFVTPEGHLLTSIHALLVEAAGVKIVVDTCVGNDKPRRIVGGHALQTEFLAALAAAGCTRDAVDMVVCTHLHVDHVGWNTLLENGRWVPTFPRARYLIGREEHAFWKQHDRDDKEQQAILLDSITPVFDAGLVDLVEMDHRLTPEIRLLPSAGHTPGHVSVLIESRGQSALITGDIMHHPCQMGRPDWATSFDSDLLAAERTRKAMLERFADQPVLVIGTHFAAPTAGRVKRDGETYRFDVA